MRIMLIDIDTLRSDHMGCYGYGRNTTPVMDEIAKEGVLFRNYYCPNAPCLPSRASLVTGQYGIHNGIVGHGGTAADLRLQGTTRDFRDTMSMNNLFMQFRNAGFYTVSFSTFAERHSAWWFNCGFNECVNVGECGMESGEAVTPHVLNWLENNAEKDNWMLHIHYWDPHTPYRTPADYEDHFSDTPLPDDWITDEIFAEHLMHIGPHGANEIYMWTDAVDEEYPKHPGRLRTKEEAKHFIDLYDESIRYTDDNIGKLLDVMKKKGLYNDDLAIIITSDHGEDMGEFGIYGEHGVADDAVCRIPMIIKWPGGLKGKEVEGFHDNVDLLPTIRELLNIQKKTNYQYDGVSYAKTLLEGTDCSREYEILTQCAHVCQRSARFDKYIYIRTIHGGYHLFPEEMFFDVEADPHQLHNLAEERPDLCAKGAKMILDWTDQMMRTSQSDIDPMWTVMRQGGPLHSRGMLNSYIDRLDGTERAYGIPLLKEQYKDEL